MIIENIRYMLYQYRTQTALYFGHRFAISGVPDGYMAGGGYILSKKAMSKLVKNILDNNEICPEGLELDDVLIGQCLYQQAIMVDCRDDNKQKRFFPIGVEEHMKPPGDIDKTFWYYDYMYFNTSQGNLDCCSDTIAGMHYIAPPEMYYLEYLIYHVHPFGLEINVTESLPRKYSLREIIAASDSKSYAPNYEKHRKIHKLDKSEKFKK